MYRKIKRIIFLDVILLLTLVFFLACSGTSSFTNYHDPEMDFASLRTIAVLPFSNLAQDRQAADRVRDSFINNLLSTGTLYVVPTGEVARGILRAGINDPTAPSGEEAAKLSAVIKADAVITGVVREYGEVRSGSTTSNVISLSVQMIEAGKQKVVWSASSTKGGVSFGDRLLGGGGRPMNEITEAAVNDIINQLFQFSK